MPDKGVVGRPVPGKKKKKTRSIAGVQRRDREVGHEQLLQIQVVHTLGGR